MVYSGNNQGAFSLDGGQTFTFMDPNTIFSPRAGGFAGDTAIRYAPSINRFIWLMQYWCPPPATDCTGPDKNNLYRLAVASPAAIRTHKSNPGRAWTTYSLYARSTFGFKSDWFDYPDMQVGRRYLYLTWDTVGTNPQESVNSRIRLSDLGAARSIRIGWFKVPNIFSRVAQNSGQYGFYLQNGEGNDADAHDTAYVWDDASSLIYKFDLPHSRRPDEDYTSNTPLGQNWTGRIDKPVVKGATRRGQELWLAWTAAKRLKGAKRDSWSQTHIQIAVYDLNQLTKDRQGKRAIRLAAEDFIWNPDFAFANPALATNSEGDVGISFSYGGPRIAPSAGAGIITGGHELVANMRGDPANGAGQGDYTGIEPDWPMSTRFVASGYAVKEAAGNPNGSNHWGFIRFGREFPRPAPPP